MRIYHITILVILAALIVSCSSFAVPTKQPIPARPSIGGAISGLPDNVTVTIRVRTLGGQEVLRGKQLGTGSWKVAITKAGGVDYAVTAEAEKYISQPASYVIHISDDTAYLVRDGQVSNEEAIHLDFHFVEKD